ncbi:hypothetical protein [Pseudodesulfovibrio methanolicus]|uniref:Teneurin-like YD-shell domain-containing protein n=1 Tax=Pseudodesulfovibrio methanolicus TaxID=3126690 RepID=A0ABZ2IYQ5_9BACT
MRSHKFAEGTQKALKGSPEGKLSRKFPLWPPEACFATAGANYRDYQYTPDNRLMRAGGGQYSHDERGFRSIWSDKGVYTLYEYSPDYRLLKAEEEDRDKAFTFTHDEDGRRVAKYLNGQLVEAYQWLDFVRLTAFYDGQHQYEFAYRNGERTSFAMRRDDGTVAGLFYDQVGSLRVVADMDDNVIKEILYDPFGGIIEDTNPALRLPFGIAGGLHDREPRFHPLRLAGPRRGERHGRPESPRRQDRPMDRRRSPRTISRRAEHGFYYEKAPCGVCGGGLCSLVGRAISRTLR